MNPDPKTHTLRIGIIGGGFCGALTAVHLLRNNRDDISLLLFDAANDPGKGVAYSTYTASHLLNVKAKNMSAFPEDPEHFVRWLLNREAVGNVEKEMIAESYQPRATYGTYLAELFSHECRHSAERLQVIRKRVTGFRKSGTLHLLTAADGSEYEVDRTVLATGNFAPGKPKGVPLAFTSSKLYFSDPWSKQAVMSYGDNRPVLIVGTGLTMVDVVQGLREEGYEGKIVALSPKGFRILSHRDYEPQPQILDALHPPYRLDEVFRLFRKHIREVHARGVSGEAVVDAVRSKTSDIWASFSLEEKKRFMAHLRHLWGLARHRLPKEIHTMIQSEIDRGLLSVRPGRILDIHEENGAATVTFFNRDMAAIEQLTVGRVINCTGPQSDVRRMEDPLLRSLLESGLITPDPLDLGLRCDHDGHPIGSDDTIEPSLIVLGSLLKGDRWESTAVPELRKQAQAAAGKLSTGNNLGG